MPGTVNVRVKGGSLPGPLFRANINASPARLLRLVQVMVALGTQELAADMSRTLRENAPVDTGRLKRSLGTKVTVSGTLRSTIFVRQIFYAQASNAGGRSAGWMDRALRESYGRADDIYSRAWIKAMLLP